MKIYFIYINKYYVKIISFVIVTSSGFLNLLYNLHIKLMFYFLKNILIFIANLKFLIQLNIIITFPKNHKFYYYRRLFFITNKQYMCELNIF